ncbi:gntP permease family protein, partial [Vibrio parahaemolyticus V-223/04]
TLY